MYQFYVSCLWSIILEFCAERQIWIYFYYSTYRYPVRKVPFVEGAFYFPVWLWLLCHKSSDYMYVGLILFPHFYFINNCVSTAIPSRFYYYCPVLQLDISDGESPRNSFTVENILCNLVFMVVPKELAIFLFNSMKNWIGIFMGNALNLKIVYGNVDIFTILILPIYENGRSSSEIFFNFFLQTLEVLVI